MKNPTRTVIDKRSRFVTGEGAVVVLEESHDIPLVDFEFTFRSGAVYDPPGKEGTTRLMARLIRNGTKKLRVMEVEDRFAGMGARIGIEVSSGFIRFQLSVIKRNAPQAFELVCELLANPAFRQDDIGQVTRETLADLVAALDNDRALAARGFRKHLFGEHLYGRTVGGNAQSLARIKRADILAQYERHITAKNLVLGVAGDMSVDEIAVLCSRHLGALRSGHVIVDPTPAPTMPKGRRIIIVDKPDRTQTQIFIGTLGLAIGDKTHAALSVANTVFGGTFTGRLMKAVRSERGWSYGAYSRLGQDRQREAWYMWTFPGAKDTVECVKLQLGLYDEWLKGGVTNKEVAFARAFIMNSHCFEIDTATKRLDPRVECEVYGLKPNYFDDVHDQIGRVTADEASKAVKKRLSHDLCISVLGTASVLKAPLEALPGISSVEVVPFDGL